MAFDRDELNGDLEDYRREAAEDRARLRSQACRCGGDMPGFCPGPARCPMCADGPSDDEDETGEEE
jgi:hypothetical protein